MLERLARWLRVLGVDAASVGEEDDRALVRAAGGEGRILLTRDRALAAAWPAPERVLLLRGGTPLQQLREVLSRFPVPRPRELFTRCLVCNAELRPASAEEVAALAPEEARERFPEFRRCPECGRLYWEGSHARRMRAALARVLEEWPEGGAA